MGGYRFDLGPTFFLYPQVLREIFESVGRNLDEEIPMRRLDPQYRLVFGAGGRLDATPDIERMTREIAALAPGDEQAFRRFLDDNREKFKTFRPILESPISGFWNLVDRRFIPALKWLRPWRSLGAELGSYFRDPRMIIACSFQAKYLGMSPFQCPSFFSILSFLEYEYGVHHPIGGCSAVTERMADIAREMGVAIHLDEPVDEILFEGRRAIGVRTPTGVHPADAIVLNADFARAMHRLVPNRLRRRWTNSRIKSKRFSCSTFMLYLGIDGEVDLPHHTIYLARDYEQNLREIEVDHVLSGDPSLYVQNACITDDTLAPPGCSTLYVLCPVSHQHPNIDWRREARPFRQTIFRRLEKLGIVDIEKRIRVESMITPLDWDHQYEIHAGATFNLAHNLRQMFHLRPNNRFEDLDQVYLVGGGTHPGSGLPVIFESARISTRLLASDLGLPPEPIRDPEAAVRRNLLATLD
jgi:phytoene desaturase